MKVIPKKNMDNEGPLANDTTPILTRTGVSRTKKWTSIGVLLFINVLKHMDRQSLAAAAMTVMTKQCCCLLHVAVVI